MLYGCLFAGLMILTAEPLCLRLYKSATAGYWLKRYAILIPMLYCDAITDAITKGLGQQQACVRYNIITATLDVLFLFLLLPQYGLTGYYISFTVTHALNFALSIRRLFVITNRKPRLYIAILTLAAAGTAILLCGFIPALAVGLLLYPILLMCLLKLCGIIGKADLTWLKRMITQTDRRSGP